MSISCTFCLFKFLWLLYGLFFFPIGYNVANGSERAAALGSFEQSISGKLDDFPPFFPVFCHPHDISLNILPL